MGDARARPAPARRCAQPFPVRHLPRAGHHPRRPDPARPDLQQRPVPPRHARRGRAARHLRACRRHRHRARRRGRVLRAGRQPARALGRVVHAGKPQDDDAAVSGAVRAQPRGAGGALPRPAARHAAQRVAAEHLRPDRGGAHARHVQLGVFRACLPGAADGRGAGRGPRPVRQGRSPLHADHAGPAAHRRDLPPGRRRLPRPAGVPPRFPAGRGGPAVGLPGRQRHHLQRHRHRRGRRQVDLSVRARHDPLLPGRGADPQQRPDLHVPAPGRPAVRARPHGRAGGQGDARRGRLRHAGGARGHAGGDRRLPRGGQGAARAVHRAADAGAVHLPDLRGGRHRPAPHRPAPLRAVRQGRAHGARRPDARGAAGGVAGGQLVAGRGTKDTWVLER